MDTIKRKPGGQPVDEEERLIGGSVRFKRRQWEKVRAGGQEWLRQVVDAAPLPEAATMKKAKK